MAALRSSFRLAIAVDTRASEAAVKVARGLLRRAEEEDRRENGAGDRRDRLSRQLADARIA